MEPSRPEVRRWLTCRHADEAALGPRDAHSRPRQGQGARHLCRGCRVGVAFPGPLHPLRGRRRRPRPRRRRCPRRRRVSRQSPRAQRASAAPLAEFERRKARQISSGKIEVDARIDLHGLRQRDAHARLRTFLLEAHADGLRTVLVITGKGGEEHPDRLGDLAGERQRGVLRRNVPHWLEEPELRSIVLSFTQAGVRHGGSGASTSSCARGLGKRPQCGHETSRARAYRHCVPARPTCRTILPQRPISELMKGCSSSREELTAGSMPSLRICSWISGEPIIDFSST